ncbi:type II secretion system protein N [Vreelandella utahensis]|uniref:type II secretion system protein N n=1 Tax=Vreelandella halophila TaxID=86177 RepID=UPI0009861C76|nr:type II secretion system protein N [Halomonas utahensis]
MSRWPIRFAHLLLVVLVVQMGWKGGQWTWRVIWPAPSDPVELALTDTGPQRGSGSSIPLREIALFGRASSGGESSVSRVERETAPETGLTLTLHGVFLATRGESSSAILSGQDGAAERYAVGDDLPGGAELVAVEPNRILLQRNGEVESLGFDDEGLTLGGVAAAGESTEDSRAGVERAIEALEEDPEKAIAEAGFRPNEDGPGYVYDGTNEKLSAMNLQPGDVIISVNGQKLGDIEADRANLERWMTSDRLDLEIERGGTRFSFTVPVP